MCASFVTQVSCKDLVRGYSNVGWHIWNVWKWFSRSKKASRHMYFTFNRTFTAYLTKCITALFFFYWDQIFLKWNISLCVHLSSWGIFFRDMLSSQDKPIQISFKISNGDFGWKIDFSIFLATEILSYPDERQVDRFWVELQPGSFSSDDLSPDCN